MNNPLRHNLSPKSSVEKEPSLEKVADKIAESFETCLDTLGENKVEIGLVDIFRDEDTIKKIRLEAGSVPEGRAKLIRVRPQPFTKNAETSEKDILITSRKNGLGRVTNMFLIEVEPDGVKSAMVTQEVEGFELRQETVVRFEADESAISLLASSTESEDTKKTNDPETCLQSIDQMVTHCAEPVEKVIQETTEEFEKLNVRSLDEHKSRLAAAAFAFRHPERLAA